MAAPMTEERAKRIAVAIEGDWTEEDVANWPEAHLFACSFMDEDLTHRKAAEVLRRWSAAVVRAHNPTPIHANANGHANGHAPEGETINLDAADVQTTRKARQGYFTVKLSGRAGDHVTLRLRQWKDKPEGTLVISYLDGSDNTADYTGFANVNPDGSLRIWSRFRSGYERQQAAVKILLGASEEEIKKYGMAYAVESNCCCRCGRLLTVPASIHMGMGPECASKG